MSELLVVNVKHITDHILEIEFNDGHVSAVDFAAFIFCIGHPDYEHYKKVNHFLKFDIKDGN
ncbi:DUF2442 domain-containing protein [Pseudoalteromonas sp. S558]|uniref:DUF2442 domain-containing protein n=1 Tax=Pseudoalteromonas sp. S558 TaxID=2066515 RepID=UPI00110AA0E1|nr:DUF2442 domain-containing protein [Pseudoalteromonas sp. S558]TMO02451.1 hypothetical protein CWB66_13515 [Pseudoalteromonas sp. S558]